MTAARAAAGVLLSQCGRRQDEETGLGIEVSRITSTLGFIVGLENLRRKRVRHRGTLGPAAGFASPQGQSSARFLVFQVVLIRDARMNSAVAG